MKKNKVPDSGFTILKNKKKKGLKCFMLPVTNRKHITVLSFELKCKAATFPGSSNVSLAPCFHVSRALPDKHTCAVEKAERAAATTQYDISLLRARSEQLGWRWAANWLTGVQQM